MDITTLYRIISESSAINHETALVSRDYLTTLRQTTKTLATIKVLTGLRRSGKSFLLKCLYQELLSQGYDKRNILFLNFEHDELQNYLTLVGLREAFQTFMSYSEPTKPVVIFLDEVQKIDGWESFVRTQYDTGRFNIFITGSNSRMLSSEIASALGGRVLEVFIQPYSLAEVMKSRQLSYAMPMEFANNQPALNKAFADYLAYGGFPESLALPEQQRISYRETLIEKIIINDILPRFSLEDASLLRRIMRFFDRAAGGVLSLRNSGQALNCSAPTVSKYIDALSQAYLLTLVQKYAFKAKAVLTSQPKVYPLDPMLAIRSDISQRLEIAVFAELVRKFGFSYVHYARDERDHEVDFVVFDHPSSENKAIQVCWELNLENVKREYSPLVMLKDKARGVFGDLELICQINKLPLNYKLPGGIKVKQAINYLLEF